MAIDIFNIQPHQVSYNLKGYSVFFMEIQRLVKQRLPLVSLIHYY
jgi:hypothetical protein